MRALPRFALLAAVAACLSAPVAEAANFGLRQELIAPATGEGAPARGFGTAVVVDGDLAVVSDLGATLGVRRATVRTYVRTGGAWIKQPQVLIFDTGSPSNKVRLSLGDGTLALLYPTATGTQRRIYRWVSGQWDLEFSGGSTDLFESVAAEGTIVVFGHPGTNVANPNFTSGFLRVQRRDTAGNWPNTQITPSSSQANQRFGHSVAIAAGAIAVGSPGLDVTHSGNGTLFTDAGAAYVFELTGDTWAQAARLVEPDAELGNAVGFGNAVAISGADPATPDRMLVSSQRNRNNAGTHVRSYTQTNDVWTPRQVFTSNTDDCFGCTMSLDGNWAVLGAPFSNVTDNFAGKVVVMQFASNFLSVVSTTDRFDSAGGRNDEMGSAVSIDRSGPTLFVGSPGAEVNGNPGGGVVMVGRGGEFGDPVPRTIRTLDLGQGLTNAIHGYSIASDGDTLAVGAPGEDVGAQQGQGAAYIRERDASGVYGAPVRLLAPDGIIDDQFGTAVAVRGDVLLVGAANRTIQGVHESGMVYAFKRTAGVWNLEAQLIASTPTPSGGFGQAIAFDGTTAIICGRFAPESWVLERSAGGTWTQTQILDRRCYTPQLAGDLLVMNDPLADAPAPESGEVSTWTRSAGTWTRQSSLSGNVADRRFGARIALDADLLAVSSFGDGSPPVQLYRRNGSTWLPEASVLPLDISAGTQCTAPAIHGGRLMLGCDNLPGPTGPGAAHVFERLGGTWTQTQKLTHAQGRDGEGFGSTVAVHADGTLFVAAIREAVTFFAQGVVYAYREPVLLSDGFEGD
jgi:hypothetical protein